jgi:GNAT superfamily N-acetyltransferase
MALIFNAKSATSLYQYCAKCYEIRSKNSHQIGTNESASRQHNVRMSVALPRICPHARPSSDADMQKIHTWLQDQQRDEIHGTFLCNWTLTQQCHEEGRLLVYIDDNSGEPVAYQWGGLIQPGILEVRSDMRGRGIGKALVEHRLFKAVEHGVNILRIQCKPSTSVPFWQAMGFNLRPRSDGKNYALLYMPQKLELPDQGTPMQALVEWYPQESKWEPNTAAVRSQTINGVLLDGEIYLAERALCATDESARDLVLRVCVDGQQRYFDKAKYTEAEELGVQRCRNGFYLDVLNL